jgi:hypothetical protein
MITISAKDARHSTIHKITNKLESNQQHPDAADTVCMLSSSKKLRDFQQWVLNAQLENEQQVLWLNNIVNTLPMSPSLELQSMEWGVMGRPPR